MRHFQSHIILLLITGFLMSASALFAQTDTDPLITEVQVTDRDNTYRYLYYYNDEKSKTLETKYVWKGEDWQRRHQTEWIYSGSLCTLQRMNKWINGNWETYHQNIYEYSDGNLVKETHQDLKNGNITFISRSVFTYNQNLLTSKTDYNRVGTNWITSLVTDYSYYDTGLAEQINIYKYTAGFLSGESKINLTYNDSSKVKNQTYAEKSDTGWVNISLSETYYKPNSVIKTSEILKNRDNKYNTWVNKQNVYYTYDTSGRLTDEIYQHWKSIYWENDLRYSYEYDAHGELLRKITYLPVYDDFRAVSSVNYSDFQYSKAGLIEAKLEFWGGETGALISTFIPYKFNSETVIQQAGKVLISYIPVDGAGTPSVNIHRPVNQIHVYPNPSKGIFYFNSGMYDVSQWTLSDLSGKKLLTKKQTKRSGVIDLGDYKPGIYILQVVTPEGVQVQKLIRE